MNLPPETYAEWIESLGRLRDLAAKIVPEGFSGPDLPPVEEGAPVCVMCSPHPDDEAIVGLLPYRLRLEGWRVVNLAMTLGSRASEHPRRRAELMRSCARLGFECVFPFADVSGRPFRTDTPEAEKAVALGEFRQLLEELHPSAMLAPHLADAHPTHVAVGAFARSAITKLKRRPQYYFESEFWATLREPNFLVEASPQVLGELVSALAEHVGEVSRNPYHLTLPSWMEDSARRGAELVGGFGVAPPARFRYASSYLLSRLDDAGNLVRQRSVFWEASACFWHKIEI